MRRVGNILTWDDQVTGMSRTSRRTVRSAGAGSLPMGPARPSRGNCAGQGLGGNAHNKCQLFHRSSMGGVCVLPREALGHGMPR
jgi:hypothetical protein